MKNIIVAISLFVLTNNLRAQDTFSILAFDSISREVGAAGASCLDLFAIPQYSVNDFICEVFPDTGAIASQAAYLPQNQNNARTRLRVGDDPTQLITWLNANDIQGNATVRQYGVVKIDAAYPRGAGFSGANCSNYKNHIVGPNYTIHGNILQGQHVLDSMEARFLREKGDLACKLMAAMQGAKMIGADTRCYSNQTSSMFAFLKVTQPTDTFGKPSFMVSLRTHSGAQIEPIDSLQTLFNAVKDCQALLVGNTKIKNGTAFQLFPNPAKDLVNVRFKDDVVRALRVVDVHGKISISAMVSKEFSLNLKALKSGVYFIRIEDSSGVYTRKLVVD